MAAALLVAMLAAGDPALARPLAAVTADRADDEDEALPYRQCVPFARTASGIDLYGDAHTWWDQAEGRYARGHVPQVGAVMSFRPYRAMQLGHVAMVSKVIDERTVLLRHANWSPIDGRRGQVELDVRAVDVSPENDWSEVRVWYAPLGDLGTTHWPVNGFIYRKKAPHPGVLKPAVLAEAAAPRRVQLAAHASRIDADFLGGITPERGTVAPVMPAGRHAAARTLLAAPAAHSRLHAAPDADDDPIGRIIAARLPHDRS